MERDIQSWCVFSIERWKYNWDIKKNIYEWQDSIGLLAENKYLLFKLKWWNPNNQLSINYKNYVLEVVTISLPLLELDFSATKKENLSLNFTTNKIRDLNISAKEYYIRNWPYLQLQRESLIESWELTQEWRKIIIWMLTSVTWNTPSKKISLAWIHPFPP